MVSSLGFYFLQSNKTNVNLQLNITYPFVYSMLNLLKSSILKKNKLLAILQQNFQQKLK